MHIKQLIISGFRSFRNQNDEDIIPFSSKHNVIVGRNGSGKSNFFNAIQFVLVAPRFATLSQEDRQHLLHEGAGASVISAYVEITFDNSDGHPPFFHQSDLTRRTGRFPVETEEVVLRRTIGQKKDEFFLNRKRIQKNEVVSLLESAGFSKSNPYYIVQQGKVANLCVMKDRDRLNLLKEIAGTSIYEERRAESEKIMSETMSKQVRIDEVVTFIDERLGEIEKEKEELTEFDLLDKKRRALQYTIHDKELTKANKKLEAVESSRSSHTSEQQTLYATLRSLQDQIIREEDKLLVARQGLDRLLNRRESRGKEGKQIHERRSKLLLEIEEAESSHQEKLVALEEYRRQYAEIQASIEVQERELLESEPVYQECHSDLLNKQNELATSRSRIETLYGKQGRGKQFRTERERNEFLEKQIAILRQQSEKKNTALQNLLHEISELEKELQSQVERNNLIQQSCTELSDQIGNLERSSKELLLQRNNLQESRKATWKELERVQEEIQNCRNELEKDKQILSSSLPRQVSIGLAFVEKIVEEKGLAKTLSVPGASSGGGTSRGVYLGPLIDNISLKHDKFRTAVEVAAGNSLFHVIVDTDATAALLMKELEKKKAGRLTFLPLNQLRDEQIHYPESRDVRPLMEVALNYDIAVEKAVKQIFGKKLLAKDLDIAAKYSRESQLDAVTPEGDLVNRKGGFEGGYHDERASKILTVQKIQMGSVSLARLQEEELEIQGRSEELDTQVNEILSKIQSTESEKNHKKANHSQMIRELGTRIRQQELGRENLVSRNGMIQRLETERNSLSAQMEEYETEMKTELNTALTVTEREELNRLTARCQTLEEEILSSESKVVTLSTQREGRKANLRDNLSKRKAELEMAMVEFGDNDQTRRSSASSLRHRASSSRSRSHGGGGDEDDAMELEQEEQEHGELFGLDEESDPLRVDLQLLEQNAKEIDEEMASLEETLSTRRDEVTSLELSLEDLKKTESDRENDILEMTKLLDKLLNERNMLLDTIQQKQRLIRELGSLPKKEIDELTDFSEKVLLAQLKTTHEKLKQYSGVNRKAMEQFVSFNEQRQSLVDRKEELVREKESIEHLISSLDLQKEDTIFNTFQTVSQHFKEVFRELVRGGSGELVMLTDMEEDEEEEGGEDEEKGSPQSQSQWKGKSSSKSSKKKSSMSSYRGVQVKVSFTESSPQFEMNQLSGGQKALVALAFIFAIQRCDPAPFYLFDEIDQALDANYRTEVARLISQQVNHSDRPAQFITTTFRPEMVSVANQCYGIALQNKSSHIYSITKSEAQQFVTDLMTEEENVTSVADYPHAGPAAVSSQRRSVDTFATDRFAKDEDERSFLDDEISLRSDDSNMRDKRYRQSSIETASTPTKHQMRSSSGLGGRVSTPSSVGESSVDGEEDGEETKEIDRSKRSSLRRRG